MKRVRIAVLLALGLASTAILPLAGLAAAPKAEDEILDRAFAYAAAEAARFQAYRGAMEGHTRITDGDGKLKKEQRNWSRFVQWSPDSTEIVDEGEEILFEDEKEAEEDGKSKDKEGEADESVELDFLHPERRQDYRFRFEAVEPIAGRAAGRFALKPLQKKKNCWEGLIWVDAASGALVKAELEPAKKRIGLKAMQLRVDLIDLAGMSVPKHIEVEVEAKLPLIMHIKMSSVMDFSDYAVIAP